uniref:Uncharacterized protein n=1 Tax=Picea glauca TaxID=3330 RepID=A0A101M244_PICGL|nr:hypothetical protein ABT39_MTgene2738 [Picea glauca]
MRSQLDRLKSLSSMPYQDGAELCLTRGGRWCGVSYLLR